MGRQHYLFTKGLLVCYVLFNKRNCCLADYRSNLYQQILSFNVHTWLAIYQNKIKIYYEILNNSNCTPNFTNLNTDNKNLFGNKIYKKDMKTLSLIIIVNDIKLC